MKQIEIKLSAYVDDATFIVKHLRRILNLMKKCQEFSSLTNNVEKCEASWIGQLDWSSQKSNFKAVQV